ncbi:Glycogen debranching enzyme [Histomonas meleagridis]|uniref:Glycogen debranching enzyme n=1 Tax=Histomonas meleagridis TaxID=135588 RepID=UPI0035595988|nr:Glycogen debranching enzyme [Histomonas meleagridis]KAH0805377.1 Glycogen debranching enzyme [Histomonas meleagridis]
MVLEQPTDEEGTNKTPKPTTEYSEFEDMIFQIEATTPGIYEFHFILNDEKTDKVHFLVNPIITINGKEIPISGLNIQTNYGRCIGLIFEWISNLKPISELGYNMIHLPPFQELGRLSHYSIKNQLQVSSQLFPPDFPENERWPQFKSTLKQIESELGIVFMCDVLLNHTNPLSKFLKSHPECGYNLDNTPHLRPAYYVDHKLVELSLMIANNEVKGLPPNFQEKDIEKFRQFLRQNFLKSDLKKYLTIDIDESIDQLLNSNYDDLPKEFEMMRMRSINWDAARKLSLFREKGIIDTKTYQIGSIRIDMNYATALYKQTSEINTKNLDEFISAINIINEPYLRHFESIVNEIVENVTNEFIYNRFSKDGPKLGPVTRNTPICNRYFSEIQTNKGMIIFANNGWIYSNDPTEDFILENKEYYIRRKVNIWGDNVKLKYGNKKEDNPFLWDYMTKYVQSISEIAHAIRIDNAHSTTDSTLAAGLPHFSTGFMRTWGRDTFISLRGIFLITGRFNEAKDQLISFASCLRHGLIPNLYGEGINPRYNSRDATWFFLQSLQDYETFTGENVFLWRIPKLFPCDDIFDYNNEYNNKNYRPIVYMYDIIQEIMNSHGNGIHFKEWNSGAKIDSLMSPKGFNIDIVTNWKTGFILGGNNYNCGTWMDKMGSSKMAKNFGIPSTSREGADIEIIGLLQSTLRWLNESYNNGIFKYNGINVENKFYSWSDWSKLLINNFEKWFYIPKNTKNDDKYYLNPELIKVRGVYKDVIGSNNESFDYSFRPNICIAMTVAPELFDPLHAINCLDLIEKRLMGKIGMKTLDPNDERYNPYYVNSEENENFETSNGFNYHNGPEWIWPIGYFFRASMRFRRGLTVKMKKMLLNIKKELFNSYANGLPELTQKNGEKCFDACDNQAWSVAAVLDILYDYSLYTEDNTMSWNDEEEE